MIANAASLKGKIRNLAKEKNISAQIILQNFMFERFLQRLALSEYRDKFIIKGGLLVSAMVGLETRASIDLDVTIRSLPLDEANLRISIQNICAVSVDDNITFELLGISTIRQNDEYGGLRVSLGANYDMIKTPLSIDITTGDIITPKPVLHRFSDLFDEQKSFELWAYNIETVLAEKVETILRRGVFNTRPRDFYDIYILTKTQDYDFALVKKALDATAAHRGTAERIKDTALIMQIIRNSDELQKQWQNYQREYQYAKSITFMDTIQAVQKLL